jgi:hypothetical protein
LFGGKIFHENIPRARLFPAPVIMNVIKLTRKDTPAAKAKLLDQLKAAHADKKNATLLKVADDEEEIEAVLIPHQQAFSRIFTKIARSKDTIKSDFQWDDHELEALLGLGAIQVFDRKVSMLLVDIRKKSKFIFALVDKEFFEANQ